MIQRNLLGPERFPTAYAARLERFGYRDSPLEAMAYRLDRLFQKELRRSAWNRWWARS